MKIAAIIPIWNGNAEQHWWTMQNVTTLLGCRDIRPIYVDNASPWPITRPWLREKLSLHKEAVLVENEKNLGYGGALNQGLLMAYERGDDFFICLNNDIEFHSPTWHMPLWDMHRRNPKALIGQLLIPNNRWVYFDDAHHPYLQGHCLAFGRTFLEDVGFFDEIFFPAWAEDVELSWRAGQRGYGLIAVPDLDLFHAGGRTGYDGRVGEYLSEMERRVGAPAHLARAPENIRAAGIITQLQVDKFIAKVRSGNLDWSGPHVGKETP